MSPVVIGKNFTRALGAQMHPAAHRVVRLRPSRPRFRSGACPYPMASIASGTSGTTASTSQGYRKVPGVIYARRFRIVEGETGATMHVLDEFEHEKVSETPEWNKQREGSSPSLDAGCTTRCPTRRVPRGCIGRALPK